jgi:hypothetical protein
MAQEVEHLPGKLKAQSSTPVLPKRKEKTIDVSREKKTNMHLV